MYYANAREPHMKLILGELHKTNSLRADVHPRGHPVQFYFIFIYLFIYFYLFIYIYIFFWGVGWGGAVGRGGGGRGVCGGCTYLIS